MWCNTSFSVKIQPLYRIVFYSIVFHINLHKYRDTNTHTHTREKYIPERICLEKQSACHLCNHEFTTPLYLFLQKCTWVCVCLSVYFHPGSIVVCLRFYTLWYSVVGMWLTILLKRFFLLLPKMNIYIIQNRNRGKRWLNIVGMIPIPLSEATVTKNSYIGSI